MKDQQIPNACVAKYAGLHERDFCMWLLENKKIPFINEWKIYYLLGIEDLDDLSQAK
jgi:hypothetical protein